MHKIPVGETISGAYGFAFAGFLTVLGTVWFPYLLLLAIDGGAVYLIAPDLPAQLMHGNIDMSFVYSSASRARDLHAREFRLRLDDHRRPAGARAGAGAGTDVLLLFAGRVRLADVGRLLPRHRRAHLRRRDHGRGHDGAVHRRRPLRSAFRDSDRRDPGHRRRSAGSSMPACVSPSSCRPSSWPRRTSDSSAPGSWAAEISGGSSPWPSSSSCPSLIGLDIVWSAVIGPFIPFDLLRQFHQGMTPDQINDFYAGNR